MRLFRLTFLAMVLCAPTLPVHAQSARAPAPPESSALQDEQAAPTAAPADEKSDDDADAAQARENRARRAENMSGERAFWAALRDWPIRPNKEDEAALRPGEEQELLDFAKEQMPPLFVDLSQAREKNPRAFAQRFQHLAPRLRFLRRIVTRNPQAAAPMLAHLRAQFQVERARRALQRSMEPSAPAILNRARIEGALREALTRTTQAEIDVLRVQADWMENSRDEIIDERLQTLLAPDTPLAQHAPRMRQAITDVRAARAERDAATTDEARAAADRRVRELEVPLREAGARRLTEEITTRRERADDQERTLTETVDRRFAQIVEAAQHAASSRATGETPPRRDGR